MYVHINIKEKTLVHLRLQRKRFECKRGNVLTRKGIEIDY